MPEAGKRGGSQMRRGGSPLPAAAGFLAQRRRGAKSPAARRRGSPLPAVAGLRGGYGSPPMPKAGKPGGSRKDAKPQRG
jgi:hypothetical protein